MNRKSVTHFKNQHVFIFMIIMIVALVISAMSFGIHNSENINITASAADLQQVNARLKNPNETYTGRGISAIFEFTDATSGSIVDIAPTHITVTYNGLQTLPVAKGEYKAKVTVGSQSNKQIVGGSYEATFTIGQRVITITDSSIKILDKTYNGLKTATVVSGSYTVSGILDSDSGKVVVGAEAMFDNENAGSNKPVSINYTLSGEKATNYKLSKATATSSGNIIKKKLTLADDLDVIIPNIMSKNNTKTYDGSDKHPILPELALKDSIAGEISKIYLLITYSQINVGENFALNLSFIDNNEGKPYNGENYELPNLPANKYFGSITKKEITVDKSKILITRSKVYDKSTAARTEILAGAFGGIVSGENIMPTVHADFDGYNFGAHSISVYFGLTNGEAKNYSITTAYDISGNDISITKRKLEITDLQIEKNKEFDNTTTGIIAKKGTIQNLCPGDIVVYTVSATFDSVEIGDSKRITVTFSNISDNNYELPDNIVYGDGKITKRVLRFNLPSLTKDKVYDGSANIQNIGTVELLNLVTGYGTVTMTVSCEFSSKTAGFDKKIVATPTALTGAHANYYSMPENQSFYGSISKKKLTTSNAIKVMAKKEFDGTNIAIISNIGETLVFNGIESGDIVSGTVSAKYDSNVVGLNKTISILYQLSGADAENYEVDAETAIKNGEIVPKKITINITNILFSFGEVGDPVITYGNVSSELLHDFPVNVEIIYTIDGMPSNIKPQNVGKYDLLVRSISTNYEGSTSVVFTIDQVTPTLTAKDYEKPYNLSEMDIPALIEFNKNASNISGVKIKFLFYTDETCSLPLVGVPKNAGVYGYKIACDKTDNYNAAESAPKKITITKLSAEITILNTTQRMDEINGNKVEVVVNPSNVSYIVEYYINNAWVEICPKKTIGKYEVRVTINDVNYKGVKSADFNIIATTLQFEIIPNLGAITKVSDSRFTAIYEDGARYGFTIRSADHSVTADSFKFEYETTSGLKLVEMPYESGNYIIRAKYSGTDRTGEAEILFIINKKDISASITIDENSLTQYYDGKTKTITATAEKTVIFDFYYTISGISVKSIIDSGSYDVRAEINNKNYIGTKTVKLKVEKSNRILALIDNPSPSFKFSGVRFDPKTLFVIKDNGETTSDISGVAITYEFQNSRGEPLDSSPINSGMYKARARFSDDRNYNDVSFTPQITFSIVQTKVQIEWLTREQYNGEWTIVSTYDPNNRFDLKAADVKFTNADGKEMNLFSAVTIEYYEFTNAKDKVTPVSVGKYIIKIIIAQTDNYEAKIDTQVLIIAQKKIENPDNIIEYVKENNQYMWNDGRSHDLVIRTFPADLAYSVTYFKKSDTDRKTPIDEIGRQMPEIYTAVVKITDGNYFGEFIYEVIVSKKKVTVEISDTAFIYGAPGDVTVKLTLPDNEVVQSNLDVIIEYYDNKGKQLPGIPKNAGKYNVKVYIVDDYHEGKMESEYLVEKAQLFVNFQNILKTYDKKAPTATVKCIGFVYDETENDLNIKPSSLYIMSAYINSGVHNITAPSGESDNYRFICSGGQVIVDKKEITLTIVDGLEMEEGTIFDLLNRANYTIAGLMDGDANAFINVPTLKVFNAVGDDVTAQLRTLPAGNYTVKLVGGTSDNYKISDNSYLGSKPFTIFSNTIKSENGATVIKNGKFVAGAVVYFDAISGGNALYKSTKKLTGKDIFGSKVLATFELKVLVGTTVVNSNKGDIELIFARPAINFEKEPIMYVNVNGVLTKLTYVLGDNNTIIVTLPSANCAITFIEVVSYNWLIYVFVGIVVVIAGIIITVKRVKFLKMLPDEVDEKGTALEVAPERTEDEEIASEADEFAALIKKAETGQLEELPPVEPPKPTIKSVPIVEGEPKKKKENVADRILNMTVEKLKEQHGIKSDENSETKEKPQK